LPERAPPTPLSTPRPRRRALAALIVPVLVCAIAGCGSSSHADGTEADPATAVPATVPLYLGATVRPAGAESSGALAAGKKLTGQADPYLRLLGALRTPGSPALDLSRDVDPWLGPHAGLFLNSLSAAGPLLSVVQKALSGSGQPSSLNFGGSGGVDGALVMDTSDASAARAFLATQAKRAGAHSRSYRGVSYEVTGAGLALGLVGRFAVIGSEAGLRGVIGATQGETALSAAAGYKKLTAGAPAGAIGHLFVNPEAGAPAPGGDSGLLALLSGRREANISLLAKAGSLTLDVDTLAAPGTGAGLLSGDPQSAKALAELPGESWLSIGLDKIGANLPGDVAGLRALGSLLGGESSSEATATLSIGSLVAGLTGPLSVLGADSAQARQDYRDWMGSGGIFTGGSSVLELKAGVVILSNDPARSKAAVAKLGAQLRRAGDSVTPARIAGTEAAISARVNGLPLAMDIAAGRGADGRARFVLGLGEESVKAALAPPSTLSGSAARTAGIATLGESIQPSLLVDFPTLLGLLESIGLTEDPSLAQFLPYLRATSTLSGGGKALGGELERFRIVLGLHQAGQE
jgi:Protein of unknown function (DUF3352)